MQVSVPQETPASSTNPLEVGDATGSAAATTVTPSPTLPRSSNASMSAALPYSPPSDAEAVELDPATLWAALDLPAPESMPSQHTSRRVLLLGRPLSGKRTLCRRLCFAAEAQYAGSDDANDGDGERGGSAVDNERQALYNPPSSDDEDAALFPSQHVGGWNMPGAYSSAGAMQQRTTTGPHDHTSPLSHGSGVCFDYVVQRVPTRLARTGPPASSAAAGGSNATASSAAAAAANVSGGGGGGTDSTGRRSSAAGFAASGPLGGTVRRTTEFFCCDSVGALAMALPSLSHVESALVVMVVDVSDVATIRPQLDYCYSTLDTYVANLLRTQAPSHDEVRRMQLAAAQQDFWFAEEQKLRTTRATLAAGPATAAGGPSSASAASPTSRDASGDVLFKDPAANLDKVNSTVFRVPASAGTVCTTHSMIVCTKIENLDRASRALGVVDGSTYENEALMDRLGVPADVRLAMRRSRLSLLCLAAQLVRQYAIYRRAALASVCQRVSMTTAGASGEYATSGLVHPFFKGLWAYMAYVLYNSKDPNASLPADVLRVCGARMHPHALLPCGLDAIGLLNPFVTSSSMQLPEGPSLTSPEEPADSAIHTTAESVITPDGVFALHQRYIQQTQTQPPGSPPMWARLEDPAASPDAMVWDSM